MPAATTRQGETFIRSVAGTSVAKPKDSTARKTRASRSRAARAVSSVNVTFAPTARPRTSAGREGTLRSVAHKLWSESVGVVVIGDERHALAVISERDIVAELAHGADPDVTTAGDTMTAHVISVRPEDPLYEAAGHMLDDGIRHLPVIDKDHRVAGMVSVRDLLRPLLLDALSGPIRGPITADGEEDLGVE